MALSLRNPLTGSARLGLGNDFALGDRFGSRARREGCQDVLPTTPPQKRRGFLEVQRGGVAVVAVPLHTDTALIVSFTCSGNFQKNPISYEILHSLAHCPSDFLCHVPPCARCSVQPPWPLCGQSIPASGRLHLPFPRLGTLPTVVCASPPDHSPGEACPERPVPRYDVTGSAPHLGVGGSPPKCITAA